MSEAARLIDDLMRIHPKGFDLSLDRISRLLGRLGNPQDRLPPVIHVAGTNGKGSTIAFCRAMLEAAGLAVHVHTSPHLVNWHERFRLGKKGATGALVDDATLADAIDRVAKANGGEPITVFELLSAVTFILFSEHSADVALIEVGLGGRFDATNVMATKDLAVIAPVDLDHEAYLGTTIAKIAFEKAGIIKPGVPVISGRQHGDAIDVIRRQAERNGASIIGLGEDFQAEADQGRLVYHGADDVVLDLPLPTLPGPHQIDNAALAIAACRHFAAGREIEISVQSLAEGIRNASWPGRMQALMRGKLVDQIGGASEIWLDGGHNPSAADMLAKTLQQLQNADPKPLKLVCGMLTTKEPTGYFAALESLAPAVLCVPVSSSDAGFAPEQLADIAEKAGLDANAHPSLVTALAEIESDGGACRIVISGSLYLVGEALEHNGTPPR